MKRLVLIGCCALGLLAWASPVVAGCIDPPTTFVREKFISIYGGVCAIAGLPAGQALISPTIILPAPFQLQAVRMWADKNPGTQIELHQILVLQYPNGQQVNITSSFVNFDNWRTLSLLLPAGTSISVWTYGEGFSCQADGGGCYVGQRVELIGQ